MTRNDLLALISCALFAAWVAAYAVTVFLP